MQQAASSSSSSSSLSRQHSQTDMIMLQQLLGYRPVSKPQHTVAFVTSRSSGLKECIHLGRKSQLWSVVGRRRGLWACITFTTAMKTVTPRKGAPTPAITRHPAMERPSTSDGRSKKHRRRYTTANQRYLAVRSPRTRAIDIGRRVKGRGYHSRIPKTLKKR
ncbi:hypothetical protein EYF80_024992 [Liparis tanakae]|uniref:Uncharacterized protein n=1 Tax=Liparis tanakae TaxID=230148 RepID=A0A4Z2HFZ5_9TELE|nr:hypothetical protein EYF80_024992 [Liparis tanakae]